VGKEGGAGSRLPRLQKVTYVRQVRPPTLRQYLVQRKVESLKEQLRGQTGTERQGGQLLPRVAARFRKAMRGFTSDRIADLHPEWVEDYQREHGRNPHPGRR